MRASGDVLTQADPVTVEAVEQATVVKVPDEVLATDALRRQMEGVWNRNVPPLQASMMMRY